MFHPRVVTATDRQRQCTICWRNEATNTIKYKYNSLFVKGVPLRSASIVQKCNLRGRAVQATALQRLWNLGLRRLSEGVVCLTGLKERKEGRP